MRILLGALALAALAGASSVLVADRDVMLRIMGTGFITAGAALLLIPVSLLVDRPRVRAAGLHGLAVIVAMFLLAVTFVWIEQFRNWRIEWQIAGTLGVVALLGTAVFVLLLLAPTKDGRAVARVGVPIAAGAFVLMMIATWLPDPWDASPWWKSGWIVACIGLTAVCALAGAGRAPWLRVFGLAASALAALLLLTAAWYGPLTQSRTVPLILTEETLFVVTSIPVVLAFANLLLLVPLRAWQPWVRAATIATAVVTAANLDLIFVFDLQGAPEMYGRVAAATGIVTACGTMAVLVLGIVNRRTGIAELGSAPALPAMIALPCPVCRRKQDVPVGVPTACAGCGVRITVQLEVPACRECGYVLFGAVSGRCPECGAPCMTAGMIEAPADGSSSTPETSSGSASAPS